MDKKNYFENTSYACKSTIQSLYHKIDRIYNYMEIIEEIMNNSNLEKDESIKLSIIENFSLFCESIYSCMDYLGYLIYIYQDRNRICVGEYGKVQSSFHKIINAYIDSNNRIKFAIFKCDELCDVMNSIERWYYEIRLIRSKETHYNTGRVLIENKKILYDNHIEYGEHQAIQFNLSIIRMYYNSFVRDVKKIILIMDNYKMGVSRD